MGPSSATTPLAWGALAGLGQANANLTGWLVIFDRRDGLEPIEDRTTTEQARTASGREVVVIRG